MLQSRSLSCSGLALRLRTGAGRRAVGLGLTILIELLLLLVLLSLATETRPGVEESRTKVISIRAEEVPEAQPEPERPEPEQRSDERREQPRPEPEEPRPPQPAETPTPPPILPMRFDLPPPPAIPRNPAPPAPARPVYGPPDNRSAAMRDTPRVGTAPNGEPLYAAEWYREPEAAMMRAYLSSARGPGWGLIACRTAPDFRVEDCVALDEYPNGSQITRSALAAAWEFRVRPPRRGGQVLVGSWVRIRIDYR